MLHLREKKSLRKIAAELFRRGKGRQIELTVKERAGFLTRFIPGRIHQNVSREGLALSVRVIEGGRAARAEVTVSGDEIPTRLAEALDQATFLVRSRERGPGELALLGPRSYERVRDFDPAVLSATPLAAAKKLAGILGEVKAKRAEASVPGALAPGLQGGRKTGGLAASGYFSAAVRRVYIANSKGLEACHASSSCRFGLTVRKGEGVGYASDFSPWLERLPMRLVMEEALARAQAARRPVRLRPGLYTVVLAPRALAEFLAPLFEEMNARKVADRDSFFARQKKHQPQLFSKRVTFLDDVYHSGQSGIPFDGEGYPRRKVRLVEEGIVKGFVYDRKAAADLGAQPTGHAAGALQASTMPQNIVMQPGPLELDAMLAGLDRALFISHIWYHQVVNPNNFLATGLVKGSVLVVRKGEFSGGASHVRYLVSIPQALAQVVQLSRDVRTVKDREYGASELPFTCIYGFRII